MFKVILFPIATFIFTQITIAQHYLGTQISCINVIPFPAEVKMGNGNFELKPSTIISVSDVSLSNLKLYLENKLELIAKSSIETTNTKETTIFLSLTKTVEGTSPETYKLIISKKKIQINASTPNGIFYGIQTLLQLIQKDNIGKFVVPSVNITDYPRFTWRGTHLDVVRHFFPVPFIKKLLDQMAMYKLNVFHWHLTDDQGWRIEIKKYPKLTLIGSIRKETLIGHASATPEQFDNTPYGGFYTQEEIKEVVNYARERFITVVPEIEMPGHAIAALSAYPEYSCTGGPFEVFTQWGVTEDAFCAGKEQTFSFLEDVLSEVCSLFPGNYIHIGGDECLKNRWKNCLDCQQRIKDNNLKNEEELQSYLVKRIENFITSKNKKLIGWDEIIDGGLPERATVMSWRGMKGGIEAAETGHDVVMTPTDFCYFDHYQSLTNQPLAFGGYLPLHKVYDFNPVPEKLSSEKTKHILGGQANLWTEYITTEKQVEYMLFPRLFAMAEILWIPLQHKDFDGFLKRLDVHLQNTSINYSPARF